MQLADNENFMKPSCAPAHGSPDDLRPRENNLKYVLQHSNGDVILSRQITQTKYQYENNCRSQGWKWVGL